MKKNVLLQKFIFMRKLTVITIIAMLFFSACGKAEDKEKSKSQSDVTVSESAKKDALIKELSYKDFIRDVWDFETYPDSFAFKGKTPCVIDFYATWCGPCKKIAPVMESLAKEFNGKVTVYKVDIDAEHKLSTVLKIRNIPTVYFLKEGTQPSFSVGAKDEIYFRSRFEMLSK